jgi:hypothetical protein
MNHDLRRTASTRLILAAASLSWLATASCAVVLISHYDETTDKGVTALQKSVDGLMDQLDQPVVPAYPTVKATYDGIHADLSTLHLRNEARDKNTLTVKQLDELKASLDRFEGEHKAGKVVQPMVPIARATLDQAILAILKLELTKKEQGQ